MTDRSGTRPKWLMGVVVVVLSTVVGLALAEVVLRFVPPDVGMLRKLVTASDDPRPYVLKPNARIVFTGLYSTLETPVLWRVNAQGVRDDRVFDPWSDKFRVAVYGDSEAFGWAVALDDTFEKRMEAIDNRVEVINFGMPGYNVENVADHIERTVPEFHPNLILYLVNKNDFDESLKMSEFVMNSYLLLRLRLIQDVVKAKLCHSDESRQPFFAQELDRIIRFSESHGTPLALGFLKWQNRQTWIDYAQPDQWITAPHPTADPGGFRLYEVNVQSVTREEPVVDSHLSKSGHQKMAALFCAVIAESPDSGCAPPGWTSRASR